MERINLSDIIDENLRNWFKKEKWKRIDTQGNIAGDCGTMPKGKKTQRCLPAAKARSLTKKQRAATSRKKTRSKKQFVKNTKAAKVKLKKETTMEDLKSLKEIIKQALLQENNKHTPLQEAEQMIIEMVNEELCAKGKAYRKRRMAAGEKSSAYLSGRAVKVCKGQMSGKKKKSKKNEDALKLSKKNMSSYAAKNEEKESGLKNPKKADLNKDGKLSSYEKARGKGIEKAMGISEYDVEDGQDVKEFIEFMRENYLDTLDEAEYKGRKVKLGKPMRGDVKKFKVYVKNPKGNVVKVNFGQKGMNIKKNNPKRRKAFRARHNCDNPGPRHKARYWSCRKW